MLWRALRAMFLVGAPAGPPAGSIGDRIGRHGLERLGRLGAGLAIALSLSALPACGPIEYVANMPFDATPAIARARMVKGEKFAPYEVTAALEYRHKSRELAGYARYHSAITFARKSTANADKARKLATERASLPIDQQEDLGITVSDSQKVQSTDKAGSSATPSEGSSEIKAVRTQPPESAAPSESSPQ